MLPCRDPIGLSGYRHALHLGLVSEKRLFPTGVENIKMIIYQDRLGTNIGKTHKRSPPFFMQPFELEPAVDTLEDVAALLRKRGNVLVDEGALPSSSLSLQ